LSTTSELLIEVVAQVSRDVIVIVVVDFIQASYIQLRAWLPFHIAAHLLWLFDLKWYFLSVQVALSQ